MVFAPSLPYPTVFLHPSKKLRSTIIISCHMKEKQSMHRLKSLKEKTFFEHEWLRQKGLENARYKFPVLYDQCDNN